MRVLLLGAESKLGCGYFIGQKLLAHGYTVVALAGSELARFDCGVKWIVGKPEDAGFQSAILKADAVVDAQLPSVVHSDNVRIARLRPLLLMRSLEGTGKRLIITSDAAVIGETGTTPVDETTRVHPLRNYAWLARLEKKILHANGVHSIVVRPATVYGASSLTQTLTFWLLLAQRLRRGTYIEPGTNRSSAVYCDDLADLYCLALQKAGPGTVIHAAAETFSMRDLASAIHRGMGRRGAPCGISLEEAAQIVPCAAALCRNLAISGEMARTSFGWNPIGPPFLQAVEQEVRAPRIFHASQPVRR